MYILIVETVVVVVDSSGSAPAPQRVSHKYEYLFALVAVRFVTDDDRTGFGTRSCVDSEADHAAGRGPVATQ